MLFLHYFADILINFFSNLLQINKNNVYLHRGLIIKHTFMERKNANIYKFINLMYFCL